MVQYATKVQTSDAAGTFGIDVDLTATPTPFGPVTVVAGETWYFQTWYRDLNPSPTSNFTDAVSITFR